MTLTKAEVLDALSGIGDSLRKALTSIETAKDCAEEAASEASEALDPNGLLEKLADTLKDALREAIDGLDSADEASNDAHSAFQHAETAANVIEDIIFRLEGLSESIGPNEDVPKVNQLLNALIAIYGSDVVESAACRLMDLTKLTRSPDDDAPAPHVEVRL